MEQQLATLKWLVAGLAAIGVILGSLAGAALGTNGPTGDVWTDMAPATAPPSLHFHAMAYDAESDRIILFGGETKENRTRVPLADTWAYDFNTNMWTNMTPATAPSPRRFHAMAYDAESDRVILFGGTLAFVSLGDTWAYDFNANTWTDRTPATAPSPRIQYGMAYDAESDRVILFGGAPYSGGPPLGDTWAYDFNANTWTDMTPVTAESPRAFYGMAYDAESDRIVLFGGLGGPPNRRSDATWAYDFNANTWTNMTPATAPSPRYLNSMAYDAESDRIVLFGGDPVTVLNRETWVYDFNANTWTNVAKPGPRWGPMAYDAESDRVIMFGGGSPVSAARVGGPSSDQTWSYGPPKIPPPPDTPPPDTTIPPAFQVSPTVLIATGLAVGGAAAAIAVILVFRSRRR